jgi:hypothetical protein
VRERNSVRAGYLERHIDEDEAKRALRIAAAADLQVAHLLGAYAHEPDEAFATFRIVERSSVSASFVQTFSALSR